MTTLPIVKSIGLVNAETARRNKDEALLAYTVKVIGDGQFHVHHPLFTNGRMVYNETD